MRRAALFALAALIVGIATASGPASAGATVLCKKPVDANDNCAAASGDYAVGTAIKASVAKSQFTIVAKPGTFAENIVCKSTLELKLTSAGGGEGTNVTGNVENLAFTGCTMEKSGDPCTTTVIGTPPGVFTLAWTKEGNGNLNSSKLELRVSCAFVLNCIYRIAPTLPVTGSSTTPELTATKFVLEQEEPVGWMPCPESTKWDATYAVESPVPLWVARKMA